MPDSVPHGTFKPVTISSGNPVYIMFDLETISLSKSTSSTFLLTFSDTKASEILLDLLCWLVGWCLPTPDF